MSTSTPAPELWPLATALRELRAVSPSAALVTSAPASEARVVSVASKAIASARSVAGRAAPVVEQAPRPVRGLPRWRLQRVLDHVEANLGREIRLQDMADAARLSAHHFSELFRETTGEAPYRYVMRARVERAKTLLRNSMMSILDVALAVGFSDQSHFSKVFRRLAGITPGAYRTVMWQDGAPEHFLDPHFSEDRTKDRTNVLTHER
jgi:transcriptional regulator GlxA family with amidase domain